MKKALAIAVLAANVVLHAASDVSLKVYPIFQISDAGTVRLSLIIRPDARNRGYCMVYEGPNAGQTCRELDGEHAAMQRVVELRDLPAGGYQAELKVERIDREGHRSVIGSGLVSWRIVGMGEDPADF